MYDDDDRSIANDRLEGARAIALFMGTSERRVRHLKFLEKLPIATEGRRGLIASKQALREYWGRIARSKD